MFCSWRRTWTGQANLSGLHHIMVYLLCCTWSGIPGRPGQSSVTERAFNLYDSTANRETKHAIPWENAFYPRKKIFTCMPFIDPSATRACPKFDNEPSTEEDVDIKWLVNQWFIVPNLAKLFKYPRWLMVSAKVLFQPRRVFETSSKWNDIRQRTSKILEQFWYQLLQGT